MKPEQPFLVLNDMIYACLINEATLAPKPGLVDANNSGSHKDMDLATFKISAEAISPFMSQFACLGYQSTTLPLAQLLAVIRPLGLQCEHAMFSATKGINTHKGAIFAFSLLSSAIGYLSAHQTTLEVDTICQTVAEITKGLVKKELTCALGQKTAGYLAYQQYGFSGARGEAESGFKTVRNQLPEYLDLINKGTCPKRAQLHSLMRIIATNDDTNTLSRGGLAGLNYTKQAAKHYLAQGSVFNDPHLEKLKKLDQVFIHDNLSPGGSADLLAVMLFLANIEKWAIYNNS